MTTSKGIHIHLRLEILKSLHTKPNQTNQELRDNGIPTQKFWLNKKLKTLHLERKIYISEYKRTSNFGDYARAWSIRLGDEEDMLYPEIQTSVGRNRNYRARNKQRKMYGTNSASVASECN
jgi:hypothetical protein